MCTDSAACLLHFKCLLLLRVFDNCAVQHADTWLCVHAQAFFTRWWAEQTERTQSLVKRLVADGQLGFVNGAWVQVKVVVYHLLPAAQCMCMSILHASDCFLPGSKTMGTCIQPLHNIYKS